MSERSRRGQVRERFGRRGGRAAGSRARRRHAGLASFESFDLLYTGRGLAPDAVEAVLIATAEHALLADAAQRDAQIRP